MSRKALITKLLREASAKQLLRVRRIVGRLENKYGSDLSQGQVVAALEAFDAGRYEDPNIHHFLEDDGHLDIALSDTPFSIGQYGTVIPTGGK